MGVYSHIIRIVVSVFYLWSLGYPNPVTVICISCPQKLWRMSKFFSKFFSWLAYKDNGRKIKWAVYGNSQASIASVGSDQSHDCLISVLWIEWLHWQTHAIYTTRIISVARDAMQCFTINTCPVHVLVLFLKTATLTWFWGVPKVKVTSDMGL